MSDPDSMRPIIQKMIEESMEGSDDAYIGKVLNGQYRIGSLRGTGGMGAVYRATDIHLDCTVAVKVLNPLFAKMTEFRKRFEREAKAAARVHHDNVVRIYNFAQLEDGTLFIVMEYVEGQSLGDYIETNGEANRLPAREAVRIAAQCLSALKAIHEAGVIHRDFKPANILLVPTDRGPQVKICDFGVGKLTGPMDSAADGSTETAAGTVLGTPAYMSPEQLLGVPDLDQRTDLYAAGVVLYQMLSGTPPLKGRPQSLILQHERNAIMPIHHRVHGLPTGLEAVIHKALAKKRAERYQSAAEMRQALLASLQPKPAQSKGFHPVLALAIVVLIGGGSWLAYRTLNAGDAVPTAPAVASAPPPTAAPVSPQAPLPAIVVPAPAAAGSTPSVQSAKAHLDRMEFSEAADDLKIVIGREPGNAEAWYLEGRALSFLQRNAEADAAYRRFLGLPGAKDPSEVRIARSWRRINRK